MGNQRKERVLQQSKALNHLLSADRKTWQNLAHRGASLFTRHCIFFKNLWMHCQEKNVSISYLKLVLHRLKTKTIAEDPEETDLTKTIKSSVIGYLQEKYNDPATQELLDIASFLDPSFKTNYISQENVPVVKARIKTEMEEGAKKEKITCHRTTEFSSLARKAKEGTWQLLQEYSTHVYSA